MHYGACEVVSVVSLLQQQITLTFLTFVLMAAVSKCNA